jgi:hypothetical protein
MAEDKLQPRSNALSTTSARSLTASQGTLAIQIHLTALNAKVTLDDEGVLAAEFDAVFSKESPVAIQWAFRVWRDKSPYFPAISEIRALIAEWRRGERERQELESRMEEKFLLEERRKQGQVPDFTEVVKQLKAVCDQTAEVPHIMREREFRQRINRIAMAAGTLELTPEEIAARREKERAEIERYRQHSDNEFSE